MRNENMRIRRISQIYIGFLNQNSLQIGLLKKASLEITQNETAHKKNALML